MAEDNLTLSERERLIRLEFQYNSLEAKLQTQTEHLIETVDEIKRSLLAIEKQTSQWKNIGSGILLAVTAFWAIISGIFGDAEHLMKMIRG